MARWEKVAGWDRGPPKKKARSQTDTMPPKVPQMLQELAHDGAAWGNMGLGGESFFVPVMGNSPDSGILSQIDHGRGNLRGAFLDS